MLGTSNFDNRSIYLNFETCVVVKDQEFAKKISAMLTRDLDDATPIKLKSTESRWWSLLVENIARLLSPLF
jgi:cardiolipin synthase